ncbi:hypothetical protein [Sorangium sp. So ce233]|uniref:hypothetical protein n=1 Tax=Sorangium sp. So ce233 TaxID=3133290 RepID=UPI003F61B38C
MKNRFSHPLLGATAKGTFGPELRSICGTKQLKVSASELNQVAERLEPWCAPKFELRVRVELGNLYPETGPVTALDKTSALVKNVAGRIGEASRSSRTTTSMRPGVRLWTAKPGTSISRSKHRGIGSGRAWLGFSVRRSIQRR